MNKKIKWVVETGIFIALLLILQTITKLLGTIVTGSAVNFVLVAATLMVSMSSGLIVAVASPFLALLLGIVPLPIHFIPVVCLGNIAICLAYALILKRSVDKSNSVKITLWIIAILLGAVAKFVVLYVGVNYIVMPIMTAVKNAPVKAPAAIFSTQQMITAVIGGVLALLIVPAVNRARKKTYL